MAPATVVGGGATDVGATLVGLAVLGLTVVGMVVSVTGDLVVDGDGATETWVRSPRPYRTTTTATLAASRTTMRTVRPIRVAGFNVVLAMASAGVARSKPA